MSPEANPNEVIKQVYASPSVKEYGSVSDLVSNTGQGTFNDGSGSATYAS